MTSLRDELDGALVPMDRLPDRPPPWHRPRVRVPFWQRLAVWTATAALGWGVVALGVWLSFR